MGFRITKVYTKTGDGGDTRLGGGQMVPKDSARIRAYGTVDELNSVIGIALSFKPCEPMPSLLTSIQHQLFDVGSDLCILEADKAKWQTKIVQEADVHFLENAIDTLNKDMAPLKEFILPGGSRVSSFLHQARCVCRRAEILVVALSRDETVRPTVIKYLNRLSDLLFVMARFDNHGNGIEDIYWKQDPEQSKA